MVITSSLTGNILAETTSAVGSLFGLDIPTITAIITLLSIILGVGYTWRKEKNSSLTGYRSYEKDVQEQMARDIAKLRAGSEKYAMLRLKILGMAGIDGEALIKEIEQEYRDFGG
jgi:hypothetical protein